MSISVYCSATHIKYVDGALSAKKIRINDFASYPLPEGALINGLITDEDAIVGVLNELARQKKLENKPVSLVVDSSNITMRTLTAPLVSKADVLEFIKRELSMYQEQDADAVYDYAVLNPRLETGGASILAAAASRAFFSSYLSVFSSAKLKPASINIGVNCQIKLAKFLKPLVDNAYIIAHVDGNNLLLTLFDSDRYLLANRYRLLFNFGSDGWVQEFADNVSSVIQFNKGQKGQKDITCVYIDGLHEQARQSIASSLGSFNIKVLPLPCEGMIELVKNTGDDGEAFQLGKYQYNIGNLLKN